MAYKVSTLKKWPNFVTRINLGELDIQVRVNTREELLELCQLTCHVSILVERWLGEELAQFKEVVWLGDYDPRLARIWSILDEDSRRALAWQEPALAIQDRSEGVRIRALKVTKNQKALEEFSRHWDFNVRCQVARNKHTPAKVLRRLAEDSSYWVRRGVVENPSCPCDLLEKFARAEPALRAAVARRQDCPEEILQQLAEDPLQPIREQALRRLGGERWLTK